VWNFIWWNPAVENGGPATNAHNQALSDILDEFPDPIAPGVGLTPIPLDADTITLGGYSVTYAEFVAAMNPGEAMAGEIVARGLGIGSGPYYARVFDASGNVYSSGGGGYIPLGGTSFTQSDKVPVTDPENSDTWVGDAPAGSGGAARFEIRLGNLAAASPSDLIVFEDAIAGAANTGGGAAAISVEQNVLQGG
jgi:hypothetical protein